MPCPPHPIELMANDARSCFSRWEQLTAELALTRRFAAACLRNASAHSAWEALRQGLAGAEASQRDRFQSSGSLEADGVALEKYLPSIQAALGALEERLCVLRSSLAALAQAGEIQASPEYAHEMERHIEHREGERRAVLSRLTLPLRAVNTFSAAERDAMRAEIERVQAVPEATLLRDRQCLLWHR